MPAVSGPIALKPHERPGRGSPTAQPLGRPTRPDRAHGPAGHRGSERGVPRLEPHPTAEGRKSVNRRAINRAETCQKEDRKHRVGRSASKAHGPPRPFRFQSPDADPQRRGRGAQNAAICPASSRRRPRATRTSSSNCPAVVQPTARAVDGRSARS